MKRINILIVEDKQTIIADWVDALIGFNLQAKKAGKELEFFAMYAKSYGEAKDRLSSFNFSAAIIDIRLAEDDGQTNEENTKGNDVLIDIVNSTMCLAWVYTGQQTDAKIPEHLRDYIEVIDRSAKSQSEILEDLAEKQDMLDSITVIKNKFSQSKAEHFYSAIWPRWSLWSADDSEYKDKAIIRHMATHLHASFLNETKNVHPEEYYFTGPMIKGMLDTGDITMVDGSHYILVTPRCEIAQNKNCYYQFVKLEDKSAVLKSELAKLRTLKVELQDKKSMEANCISIDDGATQNHAQIIKKANELRTKVQQILKEKRSAESEKVAELNAVVADELQQLFTVENEGKTTKKCMDKAKNDLEKAKKDVSQAEKKLQQQESKIKKLLPNNGVKASLHILPEVKQPGGESYGPLHAQFEQLTYINKTDSAKIEHYINGRYARLSNEFVPSFVERLGSHFSRIGTPDYSHPE